MQQLRRLPFFERLLVQPQQEHFVGSSAAAASPDAVHHAGESATTIAGSQFVCGTGTSGSLWLCEERGVAHVFDETLSSICFTVFSLEFLAIHAAKDAACIVCIGRDKAENAADSSTQVRDKTTGSSGVGAQVGAVQKSHLPGNPNAGVLKYKCFSSTQRDAFGRPLLLREAAVFTRVPEQLVSCTDVTKAFNMLALGTEQAGVCLFRGDLLREKTCRLRIVRQEEALPITALCFLTPNLHSNNNDAVANEHLFVATFRTMTCYAVPVKGDPQITFRDEHSGVSSPTLACRLNACNKLAVQSGEGIFCLDAEKGRLWALPCEEGETHTLLSAYKHSLIAAAREQKDEEKQVQLEESKKYQKEALASTGDGSCGGLFSRNTTGKSKSDKRHAVQQTFLTIYRCCADARFVAFSSTLPNVLLAIPAFDSLFVVCQGVGSSTRSRHVLFELREKGFDERVNILLRKRLFDWAAEMVMQELQPKPVLQEVYRLHADWLFEKGLYEQALKMHVKTIGVLEPSYVIEKYLSCGRLDLLAQYMLQLHRSSASSGSLSQQHTLLFFKCAAQLRDKDLLTTFLDTAKVNREAVLPAAIQECRATGYTQLASSIALRQGLHEEYISILLNDYGDFNKAMDYIKQLDAPAACSLLLTHGYALLSHRPREALHLLTTLVQTYKINADVFIPLFLDHEALLLYFLTSVLFSSAAAELLLCLLQELLLSFQEQQQEESLLLLQPLQLLIESSSAASVKITSANARACSASVGAFDACSAAAAADALRACNGFTESSMYRHSSRLKAAIEASAAERAASGTTENIDTSVNSTNNSTEAKPPTHQSENTKFSSFPLSSSEIYGKAAVLTSLEILLRFHSKARTVIIEAEKRLQKQQQQTSQNSRTQSGIPAVAAEFSRVAMRLLKERAMSEEELFGAIILCTLYDFSEGLLFLCEQKGDWQLPFSCCCFASSSSTQSEQNVLSLAAAAAATEPSLWLQALAFFSTQPGKERIIRDILSRIESMHLLPPLAVLNVLQQPSSKVTLGAVKDFFVHASEKVNLEADASAARLEEDEEAIQSMEAETHRLRSTGQAFEKKICDSCGEALELPAVHFACLHAYHLYCLSDSVQTAQQNKLLLLSGANSAAEESLLFDQGSGQRYCCPLCTPQAEAKRLLLAQRERDGSNWSDFFKYLRGASDSFSFLTSYFGRQMFTGEAHSAAATAAFHAAAGLSQFGGIASSNNSTSSSTHVYNNSSPAEDGLQGFKSSKGMHSVLPAGGAAKEGASAVTLQQRSQVVMEASLCQKFCENDKKAASTAVSVTPESTNPFDECSVAVYPPASYSPTNPF